MKKIYSTLLLVALLAVMIPAAPVQAQGELQTVTLQPGASGSKDTSLELYQDNGWYHGGLDAIKVGEVNYAVDTKYRGLIEFDLSGLPYDMTVVSATLTLKVKEDLSYNARTMNAYGVITDWVEDQASWSYRKAPLIAWEISGVDGETDMDPVPIGSVAMSEDLAVGSEVVMTLTPESVQAMTKQNYFGFKLQMETEMNDAYIFYSSDDATETNRPKLVIEYTPDTPFVDPGWLCFDDAEYYPTSPWPDCFPYPPEGHGDTIPWSPFIANGDSPLGAIQFNGGAGGINVGKPLTAARLNCEPYPRCVNDYPIYYRLRIKQAQWEAWGVTESLLMARLVIPGGEDVNLSLFCGTGIWGLCSKVFEGTIPITSLPVNHDGGLTVGLVMAWGFPPSWPISQEEVSWDLYLSLEPFDQDCTDTYTVPVPETFVIDPTIEAPLGMLGTPADDQIYTTVPGQIYMVHVKDGPWSDGTTERTDAAVSVDGETWVSLADFTIDALCISSNPLYPGDDYRYVFFTATTETFYIRANDAEDAFANNFNNVTTPFAYTMGIAFLLGQETSCESQFAYDTTEDWIASVNVDATLDDVPANAHELSQPLVGGGWYGVEVAAGTWSESSGVDERIDMEFRFSISGQMGSTDWADLAAGSDLVNCTSTDGNIVFIQAPPVEGMTLHLRVNDQDTPQNWTDNLGNLDVNIYRTTYTHVVDGCELQFEIGELVYSDTVDASASAGKLFANSFSTQGGVVYSYGLTPGAWYVLDTTKGPWWQTFSGGGYEANQYYFDVQVKNAGEWEPFDTWEYAECVVDLDMLGHKRVYFQVPNNGGMEYYIRVANAGPFARGEMGWDLYQGVDLGLDPTGDCSDYVYDPNAVHMIGEIDSREENGQWINGLDAAEFMAIKIDSATTSWFESQGGTESDELQLTTNGTTWATLPDSPAVLCYYYTPASDELVFFVRVLQGQTWKMRAESESYSDNVGAEGYRVYMANGGDNPWDTCVQNYTPTVPAINEHEWIPPQDEEGVNLMPTLTYTPGGDPNSDGTVVWGDPGLESGHVYMVETMDGPWDDGETEAMNFDAQLSSDGGESWYLFADHPDVICSTDDQIKTYWKAIFEVVDGQVWMIRVADTETDVFTDNSGNLAYALNLVNEFPIDGPGDYGDDYNPGAFDVCTQSLVRPASLSLSEIGSVGNYLGDWLHYVNRSMLSYFAWCPRHTDLIISAMNALKTKEPLATITELKTIQKTIGQEVNSYDWDGGYEDTSIFNVQSSGGVQSMIDSHILPTGGSAVSPWEDGGDLVHFDGGNSALPAYYYTCNNAFADYLPSRLRVGVCFTSAYWKQTGASFWVQLSLDVMAIFVLFAMIKKAAQSLIYMMTGVRPWTRDGASKMIVEVANGGDLVKPPERWSYRR